MNYQITQLAKSQALNLLDRVTNRLINEANELRGEDEARGEATETVTRLYREIAELNSNLRVKEVPVDLETLASLMRNFEDQKLKSPVQYFATYFSNFNIDSLEFFLAAGYALPEGEQLLRECDSDIHEREITPDPNAQAKTMCRYEGRNKVPS